MPANFTMPTKGTRLQDAIQNNPKALGDGSDED